MTVDSDQNYLSDFVFVDTAIAGVAHRNQVMTRGAFRTALKAEADPVDCFATYCSFTEDFLRYATLNPSPATGRPPSVSKYAGAAFATFLPIDIDSDGKLARALRDARVVAEHLRVRWHINHVKVWFSGSKGFSLQVPSAVFDGFEPGPDVAERLGRLAESLLDGTDVETVDFSIYEKLRLWRVPNTRHGRSGLFKMRVTMGELMTLDAETIRQLARSPRRLS